VGFFNVMWLSMMQSAHTTVITMVTCYRDSDDSEGNPLVAADEDIDSSEEEQNVQSVHPASSGDYSDSEEKQETADTSRLAEIKPNQGM